MVSKVFGKAGNEAAFRTVDGLNLDVRPGQTAGAARARPGPRKAPSST